MQDSFNTSSANAQWSDFACLHPSIVSILTQESFRHPTQIQSEVCKSYLHHCDFLVASQTGSGKTLAFAAPILSDLINLEERCKSSEGLPKAVLCLVITPTRELAQQIHDIFLILISNLNQSRPYSNHFSILSILGGMSKQKQIRVLQSKSPQIIIGTPGRLSELLTEEVLHFKHLKYLILDEADRMVEMGHFKEIDLILQKIFRPEVPETFQKEVEEINQSLLASSFNDNFFVKEKGKKMKLKFDLNSISTNQIFEVPDSLFTLNNNNSEVTKGALSHPNLQLVNLQSVGSSKEQAPEENLLTQHQLKQLARIKMKIFFISATLTREFKDSKFYVKRNESQYKNKADFKNKSKSSEDTKQTEENYIPKLKALMSRVKFSGKPKLIDLSSVFFLPEKLKELVGYCEGEAEKMALLVCYLNQLQSNSKTIIFANTIKVARRIEFFTANLGLSIVTLHSHMQQKQRLKKLERFQRSGNSNILIATDVAARGIDFVVSNVIQYGVPGNGDTYVHRTGRTARANRPGEAFLIIEKKQANHWNEINSIISESAPKRNIQKFLPQSLKLSSAIQQINSLEWIRVNQEQQNNLKTNQLEAENADDLGVEPEEEAPRKKHDLNAEEKEVVRHEVKKKVKEIKKQMKGKGLVEEEKSKWRKNKLVLSAEEMRRLM